MFVPLSSNIAFNFSENYLPVASRTSTTDKFPFNLINACKSHNDDAMVINWNVLGGVLMEQRTYHFLELYVPCVFIHAELFEMLELILMWKGVETILRARHLRPLNPARVTGK